MPDFQKPKPPPKPAPVAKRQQHAITVGNCHACQSPMRNTIDKMLALNQSYSEIERISGVDRRSISNHDKKHLDFEEAAIRRIIEAEATMQGSNVEEGIRGAMSRRVYAESALHKAMEQLLSGDVLVTAKEAIALAEYLDRKETEVQGAAIDEYKIQFNAFVQAIREIVPDETNQKILGRTREILGVTEEVVPATVATAVVPAHLPNP